MPTVKGLAGVAPEVDLREHTHVPPPSANKTEPTLALTHRGGFTRNPKQEYQLPLNIYYILYQEEVL